MNTEQQIQSIEMSMEQAKKSIAARDSFVKLLKNRDFDKLIVKGYFEDEASKMVLTKALPDMQDAESQEAIMKSIDAIGHLRQHFIAIKQLGDTAERTLKNDEATKEELLQEQLAE